MEKSQNNEKSAININYATTSANKQVARSDVEEKNYKIGVDISSSQVSENIKTTMEEEVLCRLCEKQFTSLEDFDVHMTRTHAGEKRHICSECKKRFTTSSNLVEHQMIHTGEMRYQCGKCSRKFTHLSSLIKHKRTHTGEKPFQCDKCTRTFSNSSNLIEHKKIHTGEKPYQCDECSTWFTRNTSLNRHKKIHERQALKASTAKMKVRLDWTRHQLG